MRTRKWVLVLAAISLVIIWGLYHGWNLFKTNEKIKNYLIWKIRTVLDESIRIEKFEMGLGTFHLKQVSFEIPGSNFAFSVEDVRINYSLKSLFIHGFDPAKTANEITLIHPKFIIKQRKSGVPATGVAPDSSDWLRTSFTEQLRKLNFIERLTLSNGTIVYSDSTENEISLASNINGWIKSVNYHLNEVRLKGYLFSSHSNTITIDGLLDLDEMGLSRLDIKVVDYALTEGLPFLLPDSAQIIDGTLVCSARIEKRAQRIVTTGQLTISDAALTLRNQSVRIDSLNLSANIAGWDVTVNSGTLLFNGSPFEVNGRIFDLLDPRLDLNFHSRAFNIHHVSQQFVRGFSLDGLADLTLNISNTPKAPRIETELRCSELLLDSTFTFKNVAGEFTYSDSVFRIRSLHALSKADSVKCRGSIVPVDTSYAIDFSAHISGDIRHHLQFLPMDSLVSCPYDVSLRISGTSIRPDAEGYFKFRRIERDGSVFQIRGNLETERDTLFIRASSAGSDFSAKGKIANFFDRPQYHFQLQHFEAVLLSLIENPFVKKNLIKDQHFSAQIQGNASLANFYAEVTDNRNSKRFLLVGELNANDFSKNIKGEFTLSPDMQSSLTGRYVIRKTGKMIFIDQLNIKDLLRADAAFNLSGEKHLRAEVDFLGIEFKSLAELFSNLNDFVNVEGQLWGKLKLKGTLAKPALNGYLSLDNTSLNYMGPYKTEFTFNFENNVLSIDHLSMSKRSKPLVSGNGVFNLQSNAVNFWMHGQEIDFDQIAQIAGGDKLDFQGTGAFELKISNTISNPKFDSHLSIANGSLYGFHFDSLQCIIGTLYSEEQVKSEWQGIPDSALVLTDLTIKRKHEFTINADGYFPYSNEKPIQFNLNANGNLLAILPEITDYFKKTESQGYLELQLRGTREEPQVRKAYYRFSNGALTVGSVFHEIDHISGEIDYHWRSGFMHVKRIVGLVHNDSLVISNDAYAPAGLRNKLRPFIVEDWELSLGVFEFATGEKGVQLNIPGLMQKGESGRIQVLGKAPEEAFYFAGPWDAPTMRGEIRLRDLKFTYPFIETNADPNSMISRLLNRIEWDLRVVPVKDLRYVTTIPGAPDNVYADLRLNDKSSNLNFSGIIDDESFRIEGKIESNRGYVEYLDFNFRVEQAGAEFDRVMLDPLVYGKARTAIIDSSGQSFNLWLTLNLIDRETGEKRSIGRWEEDNLYFELSSDNPNLGRTDGQILASLGYSADNVRVKGTDIIGISADNLLFKPLYRPVERRLERIFRLDYVQLSSRFTRNLLARNVAPAPYEFSSYDLLRNTRLSVGKYLTDGLFVIYTGEVNAPMQREKTKTPEFGLRHTFGLEYRILPNFSIEMEYDYNNALLREKEDKKIVLRHSFPLK
ncbi:translocation/assembly module TamB domain-containing protein [candidate division KSB1 bacterium]|nr:translocation/assembly module TamB domain-containing protein [candidate division KSB1 bacterium]